ncbi:unnamed protein product [marine sediment metagenome]|uniref:Nitroreductase domain-containing protein n=1 Tax=marine sediment metagenome TaxID=412755 RepID=X1BUQ6_9ZZZZ
MGNVYDQILKRRTIRKFKQREINLDLLKKLVNAARVAPSAANLQPLEYIIINDKEITGKIFRYLDWAGYIKPEGNPKEGEEPVAYIVFLIDVSIARGEHYRIDCGTAAQNLILAALEEGIGSCIIVACNKNKIKKVLSIPENKKIEFVVALGYPAEDPVMEDYKNGNIKYYKDSTGKLHVPKRPLKEILHVNSYK